MKLRFADEHDASACLAIYAQYIDTSITFETALPSEAEFAGRIRSYGAVYPWLVAEEDGKILAAGGENQDSRLPICLPQSAQHRHAILARQVQIQKHQIVALHAKKLQRLLTVVAAVYTVCQTPQAADDGLAQSAFVFNNQKMHESPPL